MGIDAVALLRIPDLPPPRTAFGSELHVQHCGDASLLHTFVRFQGMAPDERALGLRQLLGPLLDAHDDPRGILFFPDVCEPAGTSYDAIVREVSTAGEWSPVVPLEHVPSRIANAPAGTHEALVARMVQTMGRDPATALDMIAQVNHMTAAMSGPGDAVHEYRQIIEQLTEVMGAEFASSYDASVRQKVDRELGK